MAVLCEQPDYVVVGSLSAPVHLTFEPVGRWFESFGSHIRQQSSRSLVETGREGEEEADEEEEGKEEGGVNPLLLDPTQWKDQDHYTLLGLGKLRYKATAQDLRKAYRQKVLQYHPDKLQDPSLSGSDDHFKCIQIAYDILSNTKRRRAFDSVDPTFDDSVPPVSASSREDFFGLFGPVFEANARWSKTQPVPSLGDENSTLEEVDAFYSFWYDLDSWREFSYLDEENLEKAESREERRWMDKQNKAVRQRRKKEEMARIRTLVDNAYNCDPRVKRFKEQERMEKEARKKAREEAARRETEERMKEQQKRLEEEQLRRQREEEEARAQAARAKKEKEVLKKAMRKERKRLRETCKMHKYFVDSEAERVSGMQDLELLCDALALDRLQELNDKMEGQSRDAACSVFKEELMALRRIGEEREAARTQAAKLSASHKPSVVGGAWTHEEVQLLIKAVTTYPAGTVKRWETIARFINQHSPADCQEKSPQQVIKKVKALQRLDTNEKEAVNKMAFAKFEKEHAAQGHVEAAPTMRYDVPKPWSGEEQKLLEKALRTYPSTTPERWDKISSMVGTRTKAECIARFKELVAKVKAKKQLSPQDM